MATELATQAALWPQEATNPREVIGLGGLDAEGRKALAQGEIPFFVAGAEAKFWPDGRESVILSLIVAPDDAHETPWRTSTMVGLPKDADPENPGDRQRLLDYFTQGGVGARPVGPLLATLVDVGQPSPYWALKPAPESVMARYALTLPQHATKARGK